MKKCMFIFVLVFVMCLSLFPVGALAANATLSLYNDDSKGTLYFDGMTCDNVASLSVPYGVPVEIEVQPKSGWAVSEFSVRNNADGRTVSVTQTGNIYSFSMPYAGATLTVSYYAPLTAPAISVQPRNVTVAVGETAVFSVDATGSSLSYQWYRASGDGKNRPGTKLIDSPPSKLGGTSGARTATLTLKNVDTIMSGSIFYCIVTNSAGSTSSNPATLTVTQAVDNGAPVIVKQPASVSVSRQDPIRFSVVASGSDLHYEWKMVDAGTPTVVGGDSPEFVLTDGTEEVDARIYNGYSVFCRIYNTSGEVTSDWAQISVDMSGHPIIVQQPHSVTVNEGAPITVSIKATGDEPMHYRWTVTDGEDSTTFFDDVMDSSTFTYTDKAAYSIHNGISFSCYVWNESGDAASDEAVVTVIKNATTSFIDVPTTAWYYNDVMNAVELGLIDGVGGDRYAPAENLDIAATIKLASCMHQLYHTGAVTLKNGTANWYDTYVVYAENNGIIAPGEWTGKYQKSASRAEFVRIFYKALPNYSYTDINSVADNAIPDVPISMSWAGPVYAFYRAGILTGSDTAGTFYPDRSIQRCEVAAILSRMMDPDVRKFTVLPVPTLGDMTSPMCWTATDDRYVFFTTREGRSAVEFGRWGYIEHATRSPGYVMSAKRTGEVMKIELYYPPILDGNAADSQDLMPLWRSIEIDMTGMDNDGKVKMRWDGESQWYQYYPAGPTWQDGYNNTH